MYVLCMYVCIYVCMLCMYVPRPSSLCMYVRYVCMCVMLCMYVCMYVYYVCMYVIWIIKGEIMSGGLIFLTFFSQVTSTAPYGFTETEFSGIID